MGVAAAPVDLGQRIKLIAMGVDPNPIEVGSEGEVISITDLTRYDGSWQIGVRWDSGRSLALISPIDKFEVLGPWCSRVMAA